LKRKLDLLIAWEPKTKPNFASENKN
jgi:hypothetical protein